jgi:uncharacterized tellurite resistance protein B-like protein
MIKQFKQFFEKHLSPAVGADEPADEQRLQLAAAALLVEMTRADGELHATEQQAVERAIARRFQLSPAQTEELIQLAESEIDDATCYHRFTSLINQHYSKAQKAELVEMLWEVAFADAEMEKYEEHLLRKLSDLLYVPHAEFIRAKLKVKERLGLE